MADATESGTPSWVVILFTSILCFICGRLFHGKLDELEEPNRQLDRQLEVLEQSLFDLHDLVFDKAEQILRFQESFIQRNLRSAIHEAVDTYVKQTSQYEVQFLSNIRWTRAPETPPHFSDWAILVNDEVRYFVHRYILGARSRYFFNLFVDMENREVQTSESAIQLAEVASQQFPIFLDYLYTGNIDVQDWNAVPLLWFGDYFGVDALKKEVARKVFPIRKSESCIVFINHASIIDCYELIEEKVDWFCNRHPDSANLIRSNLVQR